MSTNTVQGPVLIGILDIQGSVQEHFAILKKLAVSARLVKSPRDLDEINGLIIPGGESTVISKLLKTTGLDKAIRKRAIPPRLSTLPRPIPLTVWGTCAGAILLAKRVTNRPPQTLSLMDISIERNSYGSQLDSFETDIEVEGLDARLNLAARASCGTRLNLAARASCGTRLNLGKRPFHAIFIRAPRMQSTSPDARVLAKYGGAPIMLQQGHLLATAFHPELSGDTRIHQYFIRLTRHYAQGLSKN